MVWWRIPALVCLNALLVLVLLVVVAVSTSCGGGWESSFAHSVARCCKGEGDDLQGRLGPTRRGEARRVCLVKATPDLGDGASKLDLGPPDHQPAEDARISPASRYKTLH